MTRKEILLARKQQFVDLYGEDALCYALVQFLYDGRDAYEAGWKDAKAKAKKETYFSCSFNHRFGGSE